MPKLKMLRIPGYHRLYLLHNYIMRYRPIGLKFRVKFTRRLTYYLFFCAAEHIKRRRVAINKNPAFDEKDGAAGVLEKSPVFC
jgi:hypothetical protein